MMRVAGRNCSYITDILHTFLVEGLIHPFGFQEADRNGPAWTGHLDDENAGRRGAFSRFPHRQSNAGSITLPGSWFPFAEGIDVSTRMGEDKTTLPLLHHGEAES